MNFKQFKRTAAKAFIWGVVFFLGLLAIMARFNTPDLAILKEQQLGLMVGLFIGIMGNFFYYVLPPQEKRVKE